MFKMTFVKGCTIDGNYYCWGHDREGFECLMEELEALRQTLAAISQAYDGRGNDPRRIREMIDEGLGVAPQKKG